MTGPRWVLHLPTRLTSADDAADLVEQMRASLTHVTEVDFGAVTLSGSGTTTHRHRVFCDLCLAGDQRCGLRVGHPGPCLPAGRVRPA